MTPQVFVAELERLAATRAAAEVVAFYDRFGPAVQPLLRGDDRLCVAAIMEVADTVIEYESRPPAQVTTNGTANASQPHAQTAHTSTGQ
jgi:hypothetical protein